LLPIAVAEEAVVSDALKARRQDMKQEPADELLGGEGHRAKTVPISVVFPAEADLAVVDREQAIVGYGDSMCVAADLVQDLLRPGEWWFGVNDPFGGSERTGV
jgi:hypothetical protein